MTHYTERLTQRLELGAVRHLTYSNEVVKTDGGNEVRNARWATPLRSYEVRLPTCTRDNADYVQVRHLYDLTLGGTHTFEMAEWVDDTMTTIVTVRFDGPLSIQGVDKYHDHIETFTLQEVRE